MTSSAMTTRQGYYFVENFKKPIYDIKVFLKEFLKN
jgi:hypothetical protein